MATIRALLAARKLLQGGAEYGYLLNRAWLDDTVIWLQRVPARRLVRLAAALEAAAPSKPTVGWPLEQYEALALEDEEGGEGEASSSESGDSESGESGEGGEREAAPGGANHADTGRSERGMEVEGTLV